MSTAATKFAAMIADHSQESRALQAQKVMADCYFHLKQGNAQIQAIVDLGSLNLLEPEIKAGLNDIWTLLKTCQSNLEGLEAFDLITDFVATPPPGPIAPR